MATSIKNTLRKSGIANSYFKFKRKLLSNNRSGKAKNNVENKANKLLPFKKIFSFLNKRFIMLFVIIFSITVFIFIFFAYQNIRIKPFLDTKLSKEKLFSESYTVGVYGYTFKDGYYYVNTASLVTLSQNQNISFGLNNYFAKSSDTAPVINILNQSLEPSAKINDLVDLSESLVGLDVDRYLLIDLEKARQEFSGFKLSNPEKNFTNKGDLDWEEMFRYIFDINLNPSDSITDMQNRFNNGFIKRYFAQTYIWKYIFTPEKLENVFRTNMSKYELLKFSNSVSKGFDKIDYVKYEEGIRESSEDKAVLFPNRILLDERVKEIHKEIPVLAEQAEVEVYNASSVAGLASYKTRVLNNRGTNVVKFGNYSDQVEGNTIFVDSEADLVKFKNTINLVRNILNDKVIIKVGEYKFNKTGNLVVVLSD